MKEQHDSETQEIKNRNTEELESMKHDLIKKIEDLDSNFEQNFNKYVSETESRSQKYKEKLDNNKLST